MRKFFTFLLLLPMMAVSVNAQSTKRGDVNEDGSVDIADVVELVNIILNGDENQSYLTCPDDHHPHLIDLGLPSGTLWSCCNVGADAPESYGGYYAWGETTEKDVYDWNTYTYCDGSYDTCRDLGSDIAGTEYDVAHVQWGGSWMMPSFDQIKELLDNCSYEWTTFNGVNGLRITSDNGCMIFFPAAGGRDDKYLDDAGTRLLYWSSTQFPKNLYDAYVFDFNFHSYGLYWGDYTRGHGYTVRPVSKKHLACPDDHHPHLIDLGLPSGTKWACCNVGADAPESYGGYYAWGETTEKDVYDWSTYIHSDGSYDTCHDLGSDIAGTQYDVAHVQWGCSWLMPSKEQQDELRNNCTYTWTTKNGINGGQFTGPNGGSIFLPAAGFRDGSDLYDAGSVGLYWSSTQGPSYSYFAYSLHFNQGKVYRYYGNCYGGRSVRPVVRK